MTWFKVDDSFYDHPKVFDAPDCALALWVRAGTWSARNLTDGFVPAGMPARFCDDHDSAVRELIRRGLWSRTSGGYRFHDWDQYQPTRDEAIAGRQKMASGGALGNHRRWHVDKGRIDPACRYCQEKHDRGTHRVPDRVGDGPPESPPNPPVPSRPVPTNKNNKPTSPPAVAAGSDDDPDFAAFWSAYPRKVGKPNSRKAWRSAVQKRKTDPAVIIKAAESYRDDPTRRGRPIEYTPHPATWLNDERYNDQPAERQPTIVGWWDN